MSLATVGFAFAGPYAFSISFLVHVAIVIAERAFRRSRPVILDGRKWFSFAVRLPPLLLIPCFFLSLHTLHDGDAGAFYVYAASIVFAFGFSVFAMSSAHELLHASRKTDRVIGQTVFWFLGCPHFSYVHVFVHHPNYGSDSDIQSARMNEISYEFVVRSYGTGLGRFLTSTEDRRRSSVMGMMVAYAVLLFTIAYVFGSIGVFYYIGTCLWSVLIIESINFIQHRPKSNTGVPANHRWVWQDTNPVTSYLTFNLNHHIDHHDDASKRWTRLGPRNSLNSSNEGYWTSICRVLWEPMIYAWR